MYKKNIFEYYEMCIWYFLKNAQAHQHSSNEFFELIIRTFRPFLWHVTKLHHPKENILGFSFSKILEDDGRISFKLFLLKKNNKLVEMKALWVKMAADVIFKYYESISDFTLSWNDFDYIEQKRNEK